MPTFLLELLLLALVAGGTGTAVRAANRRRAARRATALAASGTVSIPCRVSWPAGTGKKAFVYGKVVAGAAEGPAFSRRGGAAVPLPRGGTVHCEPSWRTGLVNLRYAVSGQGDVRMLLTEKDAETVEGLLRGGGGVAGRLQ
ncbi:hypothetical protein [Streptomyces sp. RG80]|uniref:hypothetical protein n=1 Tax=Streptomyces sp. RG80 TaxID=3157340 RepID=UPI00338EE096